MARAQHLQILFQRHRLRRERNLVPVACMRWPICNSRFWVSKEIPFTAIDGIHSDVVQDLAERGVVVLRQDEFLDVHVSLNPYMLVPISIPAVGAAVPLSRDVLAAQPCKLPKVYYMFRLREEGWLPGPAKVFVQNGPQLYIESLDRPLSYFIALHTSSRIFQKGATEIRHREKHVYYKILLQVRADKLLAVLADYDNSPGDQLAPRIQACLEENAPDVDEREGDDDPPVEPFPLMDAAPNSLPSLLAPIVPWWETQWRRTYAQLGQTRVKVWFDNACANSGLRRGWSNCSVHGCGRIRTVWGTRNEFATAQVLWARFGEENPHISKQEHLAWKPSMESVQDALPHVTFDDF
jgi:hypothetical protein